MTGSVTTQNVYEFNNHQYEVVDGWTLWHNARDFATSQTLAQ
tara:strand:- start:8047 stop:8172 length:126 start_codon:yes stop_codon:yes gene_type:complete